MQNDDDTINKGITDARRQFEHLVATGQIVPDAVWLAQVSRTMFELAGALYGREMRKLARSKRLSRVQAPYMGLDDVQHIVMIETTGRVRFLFLHEDADPKVSCWWTIQGRDVAHLVTGAHRCIEVTYPLLERESLSKYEAFQQLEAAGAKRLALINLTRAYFDLLVMTTGGVVSQIARFSNPLRGIPVPGIDLTKPTRLH